MTHLAERFDKAAAIQSLKDLDSTRQAGLDLRGLEACGWTIPTLCDLEIDGDSQDLPPEIRYWLRSYLKYEWIQGRRAERSALAVAEGLARLETAIRSLEATIVAGRGGQPAGGGVSKSVVPAKGPGK